MRVRITDLDTGFKLPNLALMKIAQYHRERGDEIVFRRDTGSHERGLFEETYDRVYASTIFTRSAPLVARLRANFPDAIIGGTGLDGADNHRTVEDILGKVEGFDYSIYPEFTASCGFSSRGCRMRCGFCVVPRKEGVARMNATIEQIYRGEPHPRHIVLLDNDIFGQPAAAVDGAIAAIHHGGFKVCFMQGINVRLIDDRAAEQLAALPLYDASFRERRLYTAFDNLGDRNIFSRGMERLLRAGFKGDNVLVYMLIGFDPKETWERIFERFAIMRDYNVRPYPMPYLAVNGRSGNGLDPKRLRAFQRYCASRQYYKRSFEEYELDPYSKRDEIAARSKFLRFALM